MPTQKVCVRCQHSDLHRSDIVARLTANRTVWISLPDARAKAHQNRYTIRCQNSVNSLIMGAPMTFVSHPKIVLVLLISSAFFASGENSIIYSTVQVSPKMSNPQSPRSNAIRATRPAAVRNQRWSNALRPPSPPPSTSSASWSKCTISRRPTMASAASTIRQH